MNPVPVFRTAAQTAARIETAGAAKAVIYSDADVLDAFPGGDVSKLNVSVFEANPVVLYEHERGAGLLPIAKATNVAYEDGQGWTAEFEWFDGKFAREVQRAWEGGFLNATSVGLQWDSKFVPDDEADLGGSIEIVDGSQKLREFSVVSVPLDPAALKLAKASLTHEGLLRTLSAGETETPTGEAAMPKEMYEDQEKAAEEAAEDTAAEEASVAEADAEADAGAEAAEEEDREEEEEGAEDEDEKEEASETEAAEASGPVTAVAKLAVGLVAPSFDFHNATDRQVMVAALAGEVANPGRLSTSKLEEAFAEVVERRTKAAAKLAKLAGGDKARAAKYTEQERSVMNGFAGLSPGADRTREASFTERRKALQEQSMQKASAFITTQQKGE